RYTTWTVGSKPGVMPLTSTTGATSGRYACSDQPAAVVSRIPSGAGSAGGSSGCSVTKPGSALPSASVVTDGTGEGDSTAGITLALGDGSVLVGVHPPSPIAAAPTTAAAAHRRMPPLTQSSFYDSRD